MGENMKEIADSLIIEGPHSLVAFRKKHGDVFSIDVKTNRSEKNPVKKYLFLFDADSVNEVYVKQYKNFEKTGGWLIMRKALGNGLLTTEERVEEGVGGE